MLRINHLNGSHHSRTSDPDERGHNIKVEATSVYTTHLRSSETPKLRSSGVAIDTHFDIRLRNMLTKFRKATLSRCEIVWKLLENVSMAISGAFLIGFLSFFLLITIYLAYKTCLRSFARLRPAVVKLYGNWWKISAWKYLVRFLSVFLDFFC